MTTLLHKPYSIKQSTKGEGVKYVNMAHLTVDFSGDVKLGDTKKNIIA